MVYSILQAHRDPSAMLKQAQMGRIGGFKDRNMTVLQLKNMVVSVVNVKQCILYIRNHNYSIQPLFEECVTGYMSSKLSYVQVHPECGQLFAYIFYK